MIRNARLVWLAFRLGALDALQYRADFAIQIFQSLVGLATALAGIGVVFGQTDRLAGWRREELVALVGVFQLVAGLLGVVIRPSFDRLMESVRRGTLDFELTKPVDSQLLVSVRQVDIWRLTDVVLGAALIAWAVVAIPDRVTIPGLGAFAVTLVAGIAIVYSFLLILSTFAFWFVRLDNILVIFGSMYEAGRWPVGIYPAWLRVTLTFVVPVAFAITVPVESLVGRLDPANVGITVLLAVVFLAGSRWFWRYGLRHYTGASA